MLILGSDLETNMYIYLGELKVLTIQPSYVLELFFIQLYCLYFLFNYIVNITNIEYYIVGII